MPPSPVRILLLLGAAGLAACGSSGGSTPAAGTGIVVRLTPALALGAPGAITRFEAVVTGAVDGGVVWSVQEGPAGGSVTTDGVYTAPASPGAYHVVAASHADPSVRALAEVDVQSPGPAAAVAISPPTATLDACRGQVFTATVSGAADPTVTWSVTEPGGGTVASGVYLAPSTAGTYHVVAASRAVPSAVAQATVTVLPERVLGVGMAPGSAGMAPGATQAFAATVTTSCGTYPATAP